MSTAIPIWQILAFLGVFLVVTSAWSWFRDQYEATWAGRLPRFTRRWYGTRAHVRIRSGEGHEIPGLFEVLEWGDDSTEVPWLCVRDLEDEDTGAFWRPVTDFCDYSVRQFHPVWALRSLLEGHLVSPFSYHALPYGHGAPEVDA
jgi:hypothetical protein